MMSTLKLKGEEWLGCKNSEVARDESTYWEVSKIQYGFIRNLYDDTAEEGEGNVGRGQTTFVIVKLLRCPGVPGGQV